MNDIPVTVAVTFDRKMPMSAPFETSVRDVVIETPVASDISQVIEIDAVITSERKEEFWNRTFASLATRPNNVFYVARVDNQVAGYVIGTIRAWEFGSPTTGWINAIAVNPEFRKLGIGAQLIEAVKAFFRSKDIFRMRTMLHIDDHLLMSFFRFHGLSAGPFIELETTLDRCAEN